MRSMKRVGLGLALAGLWAMSASPMLAADNGTVDAQVTVATPCLIASPPSVDFGTVQFGASGSHAIQVTNCGYGSELVLARGTDAAGDGGASWTLTNDTSPCGGGSNNYRLQLSASTVPAGTPLALTTSNQSIGSVGSGSDSLVDTLRLVMPCAGSDGIGQVMSFQVMFTATF